MAAGPTIFCLVAAEDDDEDDHRSDDPRPLACLIVSFRTMMDPTVSERERAKGRETRVDIEMSGEMTADRRQDGRDQTGGDQLSVVLRPSLCNPISLSEEPQWN